MLRVIPIKLIINKHLKPRFKLNATNWNIEFEVNKTKKNNTNFNLFLNKNSNEINKKVTQKIMLVTFFITLFVI